MGLLVAAPPINIAQFMISVPLFLVLTFGIGFILNMLLKTTWLPLLLYVAITVYFLLGISVYRLADITVFISGLVGMFACGWTIKTLRFKGYRMF